MKFITTIVLVFSMTGCASTSPNAQAKQTLLTAKGYEVRQVTVTLAEHVFYDFSEEEKHYSNAKELSAYFKKDIEKYLKIQGKSCQSTQECLTLDIDINYKRNFNMASVSSSAPTIDKTITIYKGSTLVYTKTEKELQPFKDGIVGKSLNEIAMFTKAGEDEANLEDEREYIDIFSQVTMKDIIWLAR